jgi:3-hydroxyisobutyrate dehydrogenase-like beta-hydroxyacid dehydrogenase
MGKPMATNVLRAGFDLMVYDLRQEPLKELAAMGAKVAGSLKDVGRHGEMIEMAVVDDAQVERVIAGEDGLLTTAQPGAVIAIHSTIHPETVKRVAEFAKAKGVGVVDAQMSGGSSGATARTLCFMVGGERAWLEKCRPVLEASGKQIFHMGDLGTGAAAKAAQQTMVVINMLSAYEGMALARKAGIDPKVFQEMVRVSAGQSHMADHWLEFSARTNRDDHMKELFFKGVCPALELAHEAGVSVPGLALAQQMLGRILG